MMRRMVYRIVSKAVFSRPAVALVGALLLAHSPAQALGENIQCVPYARQLSGIQIYGDALTWWDQAKGHYARGNRPSPGAVLTFRPHGDMKLGHVAAVSEIIDSRTILVSHSNWSTINGSRGHIENNVKVIDVSKNNDWSRVRVWYAPLEALGGTKWPTYGFIYPGEAPTAAPVMVAQADRAVPTARTAKPQRHPNRNLLQQVGGEWVAKAKSRENVAPAPRARSPKVASAAQAQGYTPSRYKARPSGETPANIDDLLARY